MENLSTENLELCGTTYQVVTDQATPLESFDCDAVLIQASTRKLTDGSRIQPNANGTYENLNSTIFWGKDKICSHELYISKSILIPVSNAEQITIYSPTPETGQILAISYFKKRS